MAGDPTQYLNLITPEHSIQPNFMAVMKALLQPLADQIAVANTASTIFNVDTATGAQLDAIGQWIGVTRNLQIPLTGVFFSFDTTGLGFDQGAWAPVGGATVLTQLPDDQYRLLLYATIAENRWDGTVPTGETLLNAFWNPQGFAEYIIDNQDMTVSYLLVGPTPSAIVVALYNNGELDLRNAGVGVNNHYYVAGAPGPGGTIVPLNPLFGFDQQNLFIAGFDTGYWLATAGQAGSTGYNPPYGGGLLFNFTGVYTPPAGGGLVFNFSN